MNENGQIFPTFGNDKDEKPIPLIADDVSMIIWDPHKKVDKTIFCIWKRQV